MCGISFLINEQRADAGRGIRIENGLKRRVEASLRNRGETAVQWYYLVWVVRGAIRAHQESGLRMVSGGGLNEGLRRDETTWRGKGCSGRLSLKALAAPEIKRKPLKLSCCELR